MMPSAIFIMGGIVITSAIVEEIDKMYYSTPKGIKVAKGLIEAGGIATTIYVLSRTLPTIINAIKIGL